MSSRVAGYRTRCVRGGRLAQVVRAARLQRAGRGFESLSAHKRDWGERDRRGKAGQRPGTRGRGKAGSRGGGPRATMAGSEGRERGASRPTEGAAPNRPGGRAAPSKGERPERTGGEERNAGTRRPSRGRGQSQPARAAERRPHSPRWRRRGLGAKQKAPRDATPAHGKGREGGPPRAKSAQGLLRGPTG